MTETKASRGFARLSPEQRKAIASAGGKAAHAQGTAHRWTAEEASEAGRKGGVLVSEDREHMSRIGQLGGLAKATRGAE